MKTPVLPFHFLLLLAPFASSHAASVINFDGTSGYSGATVANIGLGSFSSVGGVNYGGNPGTSDRRGTRLATVTPLLSTSAEYTGPEVFGGWESILFDTGGGNVISTAALVETSASNVSLRIAYNSASTIGAAGSGMLFFKTATSSISFDGGGSMSLSTGNPAAATAGTLNTRWLVIDSGIYYVSSTTFASTASTTTTLNDPESITWLVYNPISSFINLDQAATASLREFNDIQGAGIYFEDDAIPNGTGLYSSMDLLKFSVNVVPEPSAALLTLLGGILATGIRRRTAC